MRARPLRLPRRGSAHGPAAAGTAAPGPVGEAAARPQQAPRGPGLEGFEVDHREPPRLRQKPTPPVSGEAAPPAPLPPRRPTWTEDRERTLDFGAPAPKPAPRLETAPFRPTADSRAAQPSAPAVPVHRPAPGRPVPAPAPEPTGPAHERAHRLARVLVSDILVYNQAVRDRARAEGNLATVLGPEVSKAWELYKSKVSPEVAASTSYFKDALNEILAGGEEIF